MTALDQYNDIKKFLNVDAVASQVEERKIGDQTYVRVTQTFDEGEGEQFLFTFERGVLALVGSDNVVPFPSNTIQLESFHGYDGTMSDAQHADVARAAIASVNKYKTGDGPDHGNLACLWAARNVVHSAVNLWITKLDGTGSFYGELQAGGMKPVSADLVPPGGIIISPTAGKHVGHVGLLGEGSGGSRLVYSNHSPSTRDPVARWEQNYTVDLFTSFHAQRQLRTLFYRLPMPDGGAATS